MQFRPSSDEQAAQAITRLVDGALSQAEREGIGAWAAADPDIMRQVHAQRCVAHTFATAGPVTPARLLQAIDQRLAAAGRDRTARPAPRLRRRWWVPGGAVAALAVGVLAVASVDGGSGVTPSIDAAAELAFARASGPAPDVLNGRWLDLSSGGVSFPNYARLDAAATGKLAGRIGDRRAVTVFYRLRNGARLSYTVFSGRPVSLPAGRRARYDGVLLRVHHMQDGLSVVTLVRSSHTCVLAARTTETVVLRLAAEPVTPKHL